MAWTVEQIERTFLGYMARHGHVVIEGHSVRSPTDDVLFTTAGMHPLVPYLLGDEVHPAGRRIISPCSRCSATGVSDTFGYPVELSAEEAHRLGKAIDPDWRTRYDSRREAQRARSRTAT
jgi:alanyl-tRNA synthetase